MRSALTENLRGVAPCSVFLVLALISAVLAIPTPALAWSAREPAKTKNSLEGTAKTPGTVSVSMVPVKTALAVYSETGHSLDFYKRVEVPKADDSFEGKVVTQQDIDSRNT